MMSFSMLLPELPEYLGNMGGSDYIGFIVGLFTVTAGGSRFWSGRLAERIGRVKVMIFGTIITAICGALYMFTFSILTFLLLRLIHGLSAGWRPTGSTAYLADISPPGRLGEAMGYLGVAGSTGMALGPVIGSLVKEEISFDAMFMVSSVFGIISLLMTLRLPESHAAARKLKLSDLNIFKGKSLNFDTWAPSLITLFETFAFGVVITLSPDLVASLGFKYKGMFNLTFVIASIAMRLIAGKASDKHGRLPLLSIGMILLVISMFLIGNAETKLAVVIGGVIYGLAIGINRPTIFAWTADEATPGEIALSMATMLLALEVGIGSGAFVSGFLYGGEFKNIHIPFTLAAGMGSISLIFVLFYWLSQHRKG